MVPLPIDLVPKLEERLQKMWAARAWAKARDALMISFGLCGMRWDEVQHMKNEDIEPVAGTVFVRTAKGGNKRTLPVGVPIISALRCLNIVHRPNGNAGKSGLVFYTSGGQMVRYENIARRMREWTPLIFGRRYTFHCLRHTAALRVYKATGDVLAVQKFLGHTSLKWTEVYLRGMTFTEFRGLPSFCGGSAVKPRLYDPDGMAGIDHDRDPPASPASIAGGEWKSLKDEYIALLDPARRRMREGRTA